MFSENMPPFFSKYYGDIKKATKYMNETFAKFGIQGTFTTAAYQSGGNPDLLAKVIPK